MDNQPEQDRYIGIDVGKDRIEIHLRPDNVGFGCATDAKSLEALAARLKPLRPKVIALEATGGYEAIIAATLSNAGLPVAIVNPRQPCPGACPCEGANRVSYLVPLSIQEVAPRAWP